MALPSWHRETYFQKLDDTLEWVYQQDETTFFSQSNLPQHNEDLWIRHRREDVIEKQRQ